MLAGICCLLALAPPTTTSRFELVAPFPALKWVAVDERQASVGVAQMMARAKGLQGRVLWIDATANLDAVNSDEKIAVLFKKIADVGFNTIVLDVKPIVGRTLYPSKIAPQLTSWETASLTPGYDPLAAACREAKANGLSLLVSLNAFSEGHRYAKRDETKTVRPYGDPGWGYQHPSLQSVRYVPMPVLRDGTPVNPKLNPAPSELTNSTVAVYTDAAKCPKQGWTVVQEGEVYFAARDASKLNHKKLVIESRPTFRRSGEAQNQIPLMMNPTDPSVQRRISSIVEEIVSKYPVGGVLFDDRMRFGGMDSDFSETTWARFEKWVGKSLQRPDDAFVYTYTNRLLRGIRPGPYYDAWLSFRAGEMKRFVQDIRKNIQQARPGTLFGIYAGSWYGDYPKYGSNYGSDALTAGFPFLTRDYRATGFAQELDLFIAGCYYDTATVSDAMANAIAPGLTVEAAGTIANRSVADGCWTYAGIMLDDFKGDKDLLERSMQTAAATTQGVMVFDLSHDIDQYWGVFKRAFLLPAKPPHVDEGLLSRVRQLRKRRNATHAPETTFPFYEGSPGAGF